MPTAASLAESLDQVSLDRDQSYRVRELQLTRGDIKIYLSEGVLSFLTPVEGHRVAAVFTTEGVEAGDGEIVVMPPQRSERASLSSFADSPNLDEHIGFAVLVFSDETANELMSQIGQRAVHKAGDIADKLSSELTPVARNILSSVNIRVIQSLLDAHSPEQGFFFSAFLGKRLGAFETLYDPTDFEPVNVGRLALSQGQQGYQVWTAFRPRHFPPYRSPNPAISDYRIATIIRPDLSMSVVAKFRYNSAPEDGRAIALSLSDRLKVSAASIDTQSVGFFQHDTARSAEVKRAGTLLLVPEVAITPGEHVVEVHYTGSVIRQTPSGGYFVDDRNIWYPYTAPVLANFDLTFQCPAGLRLVSTGELISDEMAAGVQAVHRKTNVPVRLAGFNLGDYSETSDVAGKYNVHSYSTGSQEVPKQDLSKETQRVLGAFSNRWMDLPLRSIAVTPTPGYFGQGFPGLIYLSEAAYLRLEDRPSFLRSPSQDSFFSQLLLPHEIAHQWWGNVVLAADYRSMWIMEAMANYAAIQLTEQSAGAGAMNKQLSIYRENLKPTVESAGPVDFGIRLLQNSGVRVWETILYEKGTWIIHMLRRQLGDAGFLALQQSLLRDFAGRPITNEDFRMKAASFVPRGQLDQDLSVFFDTWVYGTGIPRLSLLRSKAGVTLELADVPDDFTVDVPLQCGAAVRWVSATKGVNSIGSSSSKEDCKLDYTSILAN